MFAGAVIKETDKSIRRVGLPEWHPLNEVFGLFDFVSLTGRSREADLEIIARPGEVRWLMGTSPC
jgi:hypothetical protein